MYPSTSSWANRCLMVLLCLACCTSALAQSTGGRILGRVADPTGAVLAGVNIALVNEATGVSRTTQTNSSGDRSEEHTSELQSRGHLVCRLLLEKKKNKA